MHTEIRNSGHSYKSEKRLMKVSGILYCYQHLWSDWGTQVDKATQSMKSSGGRGQKCKNIAVNSDLNNTISKITEILITILKQEPKHGMK